MIPDAPTSEPEMIKALFCSTKPVAHAASPEYEFNSEMTTGISAPPIGKTLVMPSSAASPVTATNGPVAVGSATTRHPQDDRHKKTAPR